MTADIEKRDSVTLSTWSWKIFKLCNQVDDVSMELHNLKFESLENVWRYCNKVYVSTSWVIAQLHFKPSSGFKSLWNLKNSLSANFIPRLAQPEIENKQIERRSVAPGNLPQFFFHRKARTKHKAINNMRNITIKRAKGFGLMSRDTELGVCSLVRALNACLAFSPFLVPRASHYCFDIELQVVINQKENLLAQKFLENESKSVGD